MMELLYNKFMALAKNATDQEIGEEQVDLPTDLIYNEVLSRIPVEKLHPLCRRVCKDWQSLLGEWRFRQVNYQRTHTLCGFFVQSYCNCHTKGVRAMEFVSKVDHSPPLPSPTFDNLPKNTRPFMILSSSSNNSAGILCCFAPNSNPPRYFIYKPTTNDMRLLPHPMTGLKTVAMELMVLKYKKNHVHYKVFRVSRLRASQDLGHHCEIFNSKRPCKWKRTENRTLPREFFPCEQGALINAAFHWVSKFSRNSYRIIAFDMKDENWRSDIEVPQQINASFGCYHLCKLVDYNGKLGLIHHAISNTCIWVMEDYVEKKWSVRSYLEHKDSTLWALPAMQIHGDWLLAMQLDGRMVCIDYDWRKISCAQHKVTCAKAKRVVRVFPLESDLKRIDLHPKSIFRCCWPCFLKECSKVATNYVTLIKKMIF